MNYFGNEGKKILDSSLRWNDKLGQMSFHFSVSVIPALSNLKAKNELGHLS